MALNAGPLTTVFNPPANCLDVVTSGVSPDYAPSCSLFIGHFGPYYSPALTCSPTASTNINYYANNYYWSPGYCPSGYTTACSYKAVSFDFRVTASLCCPTGFDCVDIWPHVCSSTVTTSLTNVWILTATTQTPPSSYDFITIHPTPTLIVWNDGVPVAWESTDTAILDLISSPASITTPPQATIQATPPAAGINSSSSSSLSESTIIIIAVICSVVGTLILAFLAFYICQRHRRTHRPQNSFTTSSNPAFPPPSLPFMVEADSRAVHEIASPPLPRLPPQPAWPSQSQSPHTTVHELDTKYGVLQSSKASTDPISGGNPYRVSPPPYSRPVKVRAYRRGVLAGDYDGDAYSSGGWTGDGGDGGGGDYGGYGGDVGDGGDGGGDGGGGD